MGKDRVYCPICKKRLFDIEWTDMFIVDMKCHHCKQIIQVRKVA